MNQWIRKLQNKRQKGKFQADHKQKKRYRILLGTLLAVDLCIATVWYYKKVDGMIPDHMYLFEDQTAKLNWNVPLSMKYSDAREVLAIQNEHAVKDRETFAWNRSVTVKAEAYENLQLSATSAARRGTVGVGAAVRTSEFKETSLTQVLPGAALIATNVDILMYDG